MTCNQSIEAKEELITRNLQEVLGAEEIGPILKERNLSIYWGTATTGRPHLAYIVPLLKIKDFIDAGCDVKILLADIHAFLDNLKATFDQISSRTKYYKLLILEILKMLNVTEGFTIVQGGTFQTHPDYSMDLLKLSSLTTQRDAAKAGTTVVKQVTNPLLSSLIYPCMQALDEEYLKVDAQFGGVDQRKIFTYAMKYLPKLGYKKRIHFMNEMIPGLDGDKMSSSSDKSKIDFLDSTKSIKQKISKCFCEEGNDTTGLLPFLKHIILPVLKIKNRPIIIARRDQTALEIETYEQLYENFMSKGLHPSDLKAFVADSIDFIVSPIRDELLKHEQLINEAYPNK
ncbi:Tyrosyl-tRNA synthetase, cytoplasmic [Pseudoloma neurophilia]|uniref:Tyrosine--tRNA ligase n=1 Tax=Pseudoloma neurophilia TaxID=146866 RepID=A0A0R0LZR8_9MICR|nr:Tyrosyl-tRNA synthetase, cytoplasmic [Pseudoloma neurophilia]